MDWIAAIRAFLEPILLRCLEKTSTEDPQQILRDAYDPVSGKMDPDIVNEALPAARKAVRKAQRSASREDRRNCPRYSRAELYQITEQNLIESMHATPEHVANVRAVAATMGDSDD